MKTKKLKKKDLLAEINRLKSVVTELTNRLQRLEILNIELKKQLDAYENRS